MQEITLKKSFGLRVRELRKGKNLHQSDLAEMLGVSPQAISKIERGESWPGLERIEDIAKALGATKAYLVEGEPDESATCA